MAIFERLSVLICCKFQWQYLRDFQFWFVVKPSGQSNHVWSQPVSDQWWPSDGICSDLDAGQGPIWYRTTIWYQTSIQHLHLLLIPDHHLTISDQHPTSLSPSDMGQPSDIKQPSSIFIYSDISPNCHFISDQQPTSSSSSDIGQASISWHLLVHLISDQCTTSDIKPATFIFVFIWYQTNTQNFGLDLI